MQPIKIPLGTTTLQEMERIDHFSDPPQNPEEFLSLVREDSKGG